MPSNLVLRSLVAFGGIALSFGLSSCANGVPMDPAFYANTKAKVAIVTTQAPKATVHQSGQQGLLDVLINTATSAGGSRRLEDYPSQARLDEVGARFAARLKSKGYAVTTVTQHESFNHYGFKPGGSKVMPGANTYLQGADYVLFISLTAVGQCQMVYGFIPLSDRKAAASLSGSLIQAGSTTTPGKVAWRSKMSAIDPGRGRSIPKGMDKDMASIFAAVDAELREESTALEAEFFQGQAR